MKRMALIWTLIGIGLALVAGPVYAQDQAGAGDDRRGADGRMMRGPANPQDDSGYSDEGYGPPEGNWRCPWCGGDGRGRMHRGQGRGMGPGMMHRGYDRGWGGGPGMMGPGSGRENRRYGGQPEPLNKDQARLLVENYLRNRRNPNLKVGDISDNDGVFEATIVTKDGSLVDQLEVDKETGWFRSVYDR